MFLQDYKILVCFIKNMLAFFKMVELLGHIVSEDGVGKKQKKTECIGNQLVKKNTKEVRSFRGFCSYCLIIIFIFSGIAKLLFKLT